MLLLLLAPLALWAITERLEHWASTTHLWVMGQPVLPDHGTGARADARGRIGVATETTTILQA